MTPQEAIEILEVNAICSPKATKFKESVEVAKKALGKQIPKKLIIIGTEKCCPVCKEEICSKGDDGNYGDYCFGCGQALDWSDTE